MQLNPCARCRGEGGSVGCRVGGRVGILYIGRCIVCGPSGVRRGTQTNTRTVIKRWWRDRQCGRGEKGCPINTRPPRHAAATTTAPSATGIHCDRHHHCPLSRRHPLRPPHATAAPLYPTHHARTQQPSPWPPPPDGWRSK